MRSAYDALLDDYFLEMGRGVVASGWILQNLGLTAPQLFDALPTFKNAAYFPGQDEVIPSGASPITERLASFTVAD